MYYVLFNYTKGKKKHERSFETCRSEKEMIDLLHKHYKEIEVYRIIETAKSYRLGLVVTEELIKSVLEPEEETAEGIRRPTESEILKQNKEALADIEFEKELTDEEKTDEALKKADQLVKREEEKARVEKKDWKKCPRCNRRPVAPWNTKGICSTCQKKRKTTRPYTRR